VTARQRPQVLVSGLEFPEGPTMGPGGTMFVSEIAGGRVDKIDADGTVSVLARPGGGPNGLALGPGGELYVANNGGIGWKDGRADPAGQTEHSRIEVIAADGMVTELYRGGAGWDITSASDICVDEEGGIWFTDPGHGSLKEPRGHVCYGGPGKSGIQRAASGARWPNGVVVSGSRLFVGETGAAAVMCHEIRGPGLLGPRTEFARLPKGYYPDGLCLDQRGNLLVAGTFGGAVVAFDARGDLLEVIALEDPLVTNVAFGGPSYDQLYITQARTGTVAVLEWRWPGAPVPFGPVP
jgi:gluconolactonase